MEARNFRYLFENTADGIVLSGGIWNSVDDRCTNFTYVCGLRNQKRSDCTGHGFLFRFERSDEPCHIFILASFSVHYIRILLKMISQRPIETVILPYVSPKQRLALLQWEQGEEAHDADLTEFMAHPYSYLKSAGVREVYLLYGNGEVWSGSREQMAPGAYFDLLAERELRQIQEAEGGYVPVVKAGYMIENDWLFYFGHYGQSGDLYEQPDSIISSSIVMFQSPLYTDSTRTDSVMTGKVFSREKECSPFFNINDKNCIYKCLYEEDYAVFRKHKKTYRIAGCFGTLAVGNVNMGRYLPEVYMRFRSVLMQVRAITLPSCGNREYWNRQCLTMMPREDIQYWICGAERTTSPFVVTDVVTASPKNRMILINGEYGYCFSGYLVPFGEETVEL